MSIQEALNRQPGRPRRIFRDRLLDDQEYDVTVRALGRGILKDAEALVLIDQLAVVIRAEFPYVRVVHNETIRPLDVYRVHIDWDFEYSTRGEHNRITVAVRPLTKQILVESNEGMEVLDQSEWQEKENLEDAMVRAYLNPMRDIDL